MDEQLQGLLDLQEVDEAIANARQKQRKLPELVAAERAAFTEAQDAVTRLQEDLAAYETAKRAAEAELSDQEVHLTRLKGHLKDITNTKEYQAYIQEMDGIQRNISKLEDDILDTLTKIDTVNEELAEKSKVLDERRAIYETERAKVDEQLKVLEKEEQKHAAAKAERASRVDPKLLRRYDRIASGVRRAVVAVNGYTCDGCRMNIPPQLVSEVKRGNGIHQCPHCHRLLYMPESAAGAPAS